jgi:hypothetical protein
MVVVHFEFVLKGRGSNSLRKNSGSRLFLGGATVYPELLGGAAVYRCDKGLVFSAGFSR